MKNKIYLRLIFTFITLLGLNSCSKDDLQNSLQGTWNLVLIDGGFSQPVSYNKGQIV